MKYLTIALTIFSLGMSIEGSAEVVAWSRDGSAFLVEKRLRGPEGGGSLAWFFVGTRPAALVGARVSETFSPGDGSRPQRVSEKACREDVARLQRALGDAFPGVVVRPDRCAGRDRGGVVSLEKPLTKGALKLEVSRGEARILEPAAARHTWKLAE